MNRVVLVTGTDTNIGKTIVTAALAAALTRLIPGPVHVDKPTQTGVAPGEHGDVEEVARLSGVTRVSEGVRLLRPMAPVQAARREGATLPTVSEHADRLARLADQADVLLVEGAGGLLVELDETGAGVADLGNALTNRGYDVSAVVVTRPDLGTLNHTMLTLEACRARRLTVAGLVLGTWPTDPGEVEIDTREHLADEARTGVPLLGALPVGAARLEPQVFRAQAAAWLPSVGTLIPRR